MKIISGYEEMATSLHPFEQYEISLGNTIVGTTSISKSKNK